jgi:hypothetical protein
MPRLAGKWGQPTVTGTVPILIGNHTFHVPTGSKVKRVTAGKITIGWVLLPDGPRRVVIVCSLGTQLLESQAEAVARAASWGTIAPFDDRSIKPLE